MRCLYRVARLTPTASQTSPIGVSLSSMSLEARASFFSFITGFLPLLRPLALAASRPAIVISRITSRSNSTMDANALKTSFPPGVVASRDSLSDLNPIPRS